MGDLVGPVNEFLSGEHRPRVEYKSSEPIVEEKRDTTARPTDAAQTYRNKRGRYKN